MKTQRRDNIEKEIKKRSAYYRDRYKKVTIFIKKDEEKDLIDKLVSQHSQTEYIKMLIKKDIKKGD